MEPWTNLASCSLSPSHSLLYFLCISANLYASALAKGGDTKKNRDGISELPGEGVVRTAAKTSLISGIGLMFLLLAVARPLIALYIGPEAAASPGLLDSAHEYVKIRALSMPTSLLGGVLQAALLGAKDSVTPLGESGLNTVQHFRAAALILSGTNHQWPLHTAR